MAFWAALRISSTTRAPLSRKGKSMDFPAKLGVNREGLRTVQALSELMPVLSSPTRVTGEAGQEQLPAFLH